MKRNLIVFLLLIYTVTAFSQISYINLASDSLNKQKSIAIKYGNQTINIKPELTRFDPISQKRESGYVNSELPGLRIKVLSELFYHDNHAVLQHVIELSGFKKLEKDLTIYFPVNTLNHFDKVLMPLKSGIIYQSDNVTDTKIASYRCAGKPEKYANDIALPMIVCTTGKQGTAVMTDPYFTSLYDKGVIRWTYPKEVGLEDLVERRTIIEAEGVSDLDEGMSMYYQTILKEVPAGPAWMKNIAMISYDYMSDNGKGWFRDIDTLSTLIPIADRRKVALCLHGWYDIVGRYCFK
jgi:hypothetical protein